MAQQVVTRRSFLRGTLGGLALWSAAPVLGFGNHRAGHVLRGAGKSEITAGFVYVGPVGDFGWTFQHDLGRQKMVETLAADGVAVNAPFRELVGSADAERVARELAQTSDIVFTTSFDHWEPTLVAAPDFPDVAFENATGLRPGPNTGVYIIRFSQSSYLTGLVAGAMTQSNVIGYLMPVQIPETIRVFNAFVLGARQSNPEVSVKFVNIGAFFNPGLADSGSRALVDQGADILTGQEDSPTTITVAQELQDQGQNVFAIGYNSDESAFGKDAHLVSSIWDWSPFYVERVRQVVAGTWQPSFYISGLAENTADITPISDAVPQAVRDSVNGRRAEITTFDDIFSGPIRDNEGNLRIPAGQIATDEDLLRMDWLIEGIEGQLG